MDLNLNGTVLMKLNACTVFTRGLTAVEQRGQSTGLM